MQEPVKITVAIPAYNMEAYLDRCLDSVQGQTLRDLEILCIDDGSTDRTPEIFRQRAAADDRIRVIILPENHGVPYARNVAIDEARGEYLYYLDSDDWIDPDYLEAMYDQAKLTGQDVVINGNWYLEYGDPAKRTHCDRYGFVREEASYYPTQIVQSRFFPVVWTRLYRLQYLKDNDIRSPELRGGVDDNYFTTLAEILQPQSYIFNGPFHHWFQRKGSLCHGNREKHMVDHLYVFREMQAAFRERNIPPSAAKRINYLLYLKIDSEETFILTRSLFADVEQDMMACPELYFPYELFYLKVILSCPDYRTFRRRFLPSLRTDWRLHVVWNRRFPTTDDILSGKWKIRGVPTPRT